MVDDRRMAMDPFVYPLSVGPIQDGIVPITAYAPSKNDQLTEYFGQDASAATAKSVNVPAASDLRARLRPKPHPVANALGLGTGPAAVLRKTGGMVWPYTPTITYSQDVQYADLSPVHSNQEILAYTRTPAVKLTVAGNFTSQTIEEAIYNVGCIHFLRIITKMSFGSSINPEPGTPPPVLIFEAHGGAMFKNLSVVVTQFSVTFPPDVDYMSVNIPQAGISRVPSVFDITVGMTVQRTPKKLREWSLDTFRNGGFLTQGGWI